MNRTKLKTYAPQARRDFITAVTDRAAYYGLTRDRIETMTEQGDVVIIAGTSLPRHVAAKRKRLEERITRQGFEQTMEAMAYTWFNRFAAIRFMELHGYLDHGYRVLSHPDPEKPAPEILEHAEHVDLPGLNQTTVIDLKLDGTREAELYRMLLIAQCNALHAAMPFLFERIDDETELLLPDNLLHSDSLIRKLVNGIDEEDWQEVEIIGWLYQFYISEKKDQVIGKVVKSEDIPAATQLFTPNWIVKYLVQNSVGRQWMATYPNSPLKQQMEYYIEPAEQTPDVQAQLKAITPESLNPEELTLLDPACGSGHILVEAYNLFKAIYQERGYRARDIPSLILQKNLFGLEIDDRAAQLAAFALMTKARADDRRMFSSSIQPHVLAIQGSKGLDAQQTYMGNLLPHLKTFALHKFPRAKADLCVTFIERLYGLARPAGHVAMITMQAWMFLSTFKEMRPHLLLLKTIETMAHLGAKAFSAISGEVVQTTMFVLRNDPVPGFVSVFFRLTEGDENQKNSLLRQRKNRFAHASQGNLATIPGSPLAYWISERMRQCFQDGTPLGKIAEPRVGLQTGDNTRFLRRWQEVSYVRVGFRYSNRETARESRLKWFPYNKGGDYRRWYGNIAYLVNWENDGKAIKDKKEHDLKAGVITANNSKCWNQDFYFRPSITWSRISSSFFAVRCSDVGSLFDTTGLCAFPPDEWRECIAGFLCSTVAFDMMKMLNPTIDSQVGNIKMLPVLQPQLLARKSAINVVAREAVQLARTDWDSFETSWDFQTLPVLQQRATKLSQTQAAADAQALARFQRMQQLEEENNRLFIDAYGLQDELSPEVPESQITLYRPNREEDTKRLLSYAIGCMMGRYSLDKPGLIYAHSGNQGFDFSQYQTFPADDDGIIPLLETDWFPDDASNRLVEFSSVAWPKEHLEENLTFIADSLGPNRNEQPRDTIRRYLATGFYKHHLSMYKRRPIYWLFSSGKQRAFQCLVYLHRYHEGTQSRMRTEYVIPLQGKIASRLDQLADDIAAASSTAHRKRLEKERETLRKQHTELQAFDEQLRHYADQRISLDLDDGVKVNYGKFGDLLAEVKAVTGGIEET